MLKKSLKTVVLSVLLLVSFLQAQSPFMENVGGRKATSLAGNWRYIVDVYETGFYTYRWQEDRWGFFQNAHVRSKSDRLEYNFDTSDEMMVPGDWNSQVERLYYYEGTVWFKKSFDCKKTEGSRYFVYIGAANYESYTYLNGKKLGRHEGGFTPFQYEVTDVIKDKDNFLVVKVDNKRKRDGVPTLNTDWTNFGGLTRDVLIIEVPQTYIYDYKVQLKKGSMQTVAGYIQLDGPQKDQGAKVNIPGVSVSYEVDTDENGYGEFEFDVALSLWSPTSSVLYDVEVACDTDSVKDRIGFRSIETKGDEILLNGESVFLRGICVHEQAPLHEGRATTPEEAEMILNWAKDMNCNFVRLAHYPHSEHTIRLAEELGIMLWSENPVYWTILWNNKETYKLAEYQLSEMIARDKNRASVVIWSMSNETPLSEPRLKFLTGLTAKARELDDTRLISAALETHYESEYGKIINDPFGKYLDVVGVNEYIGWYDGRADKCDKITWKMDYDKPLFFSEFGGGAKYGFHGDKDTMWAEELQKDLYEHQINMFKKIPFLRGTAPWILTDFQSPKRLLPGIQDGWNRKGLISDKGQKKQAFYTMQQYYADKKTEAGEVN